MRPFVIIIIALVGCRTGGTFPVLLNPNARISEKVTFEVTGELEGMILKYQKSFPCNNDSIIYNSTSIIVLMSLDTITVYTPCENSELKPGTVVKITPSHDSRKLPVKREIFERPKRSSINYPYWKCRSCKYPSTIGKLKPSSR